MSLTDIMSHSDLSAYPQIAMIIFLVVFASIAARIFLSRRRRDVYARAAFMPLEDARIVASNRETRPS